MSEFTPRPEGNDPWTIPLHGTIVPLPPSADIPAPQQLPPSAVPPETDISLAFPQTDEVPTDLGFHPRLRRSA